MPLQGNFQKYITYIKHKHRATFTHQDLDNPDLLFESN